jgi:hypothetical protein
MSEHLKNEYKLTHSIVEDGVDTHSGKYWYKCSKCNAKDWIAFYGTEDQLDFWFKPCKDNQCNT